MKAKTEPIIAKKTRPTLTDATLKLGLRKKSSGSIGAGTRRSQATNATPRTAASAKQPRTSGSVQPRGPASMIA